jgi:hypothetical protein
MIAIFLQFVILDPLIAIIQFYVYKFHRKAGKACQKCRSMGQGYNEAYDLSEGEEEERRKKEIEEKEKARQERRAAIKGELKKKKTKGEGGLFGEAAGPEAEANEEGAKPNEGQEEN